MKKTFKLFKGEIKKIFSGPSIYIMTGLFILLLVILPSFFNPTARKDEINSVTLNDTSVIELVNSFNNEKITFENKINNLVDEVNNLVENSGKYKENLTNLVDSLYQTRLDFSSATNEGNIEGENGCFNLQLKMINLVENISELFQSYTKDYFVPLILINEDIYYNLEIELNYLSNILDGTQSNKDIKYYIQLDTTLNETGSISKIRKLISNIKNNIYSSESIEKILIENLQKNNQLKSELQTEINNIYEIATTNTAENISQLNRQKTKNYILLYFCSDIYLYNIMESSTFLEFAKNYSDSELNKYMGFENFNSYEYSQTMSVYNYLLENKIISTDVAYPFSFNTNSSLKTNSFDYAFFSMEIICLLIIAFTVIIGAGTVAKEFNDGTIKLLAIRPYSRTKIIKSKILSTLFVAFLFTIIAMIVSLITGTIIYGTFSTNMIVCINATTTLTMPIWTVFIIYIISLLIKISIYALLAITISTIFRSYVWSVCISIGIYIINMIVTFISNGANWLRYNIFANIDFFKFFGITFNQNNSSINSLFNSPIFVGTNLYITCSIILCSILILNVIIYSVFKHKDIA